jgi:peptidoglycan hydrolase-like protein with peptidoglycan-binding domain
MRITQMPVVHRQEEEMQPLRHGSSGPAVRQAQQQLEYAGAMLPRFGADGSFGAETAQAVARFQRQQRLPPTGQLDIGTLQALASASAATPDYDALFADGVVRTTLAVGYDEAGSHVPELQKIRQGLVDRGYRPPTAQERVQLGLGTQDYVLKSIQRPAGPAIIVVRLVTPEQPDAKARFADGVARDEVILYGGHGRYGSGPDFDDIGSTRGNFVVGAVVAQGHVALGANDLAPIRLPSHYQLMAFDGCTTSRYFDDFRAHPQGASTKKLDLLGSTRELYWHHTAQNLFATLDAVVEEKSFAQLRQKLDEVNEGPGSFTGDGWHDNAKPGR